MYIRNHLIISLIISSHLSNYWWPIIWIQEWINLNSLEIANVAKFYPVLGDLVGRNQDQPRLDVLVWQTGNFISVRILRTTLHFKTRQSRAESSNAYLEEIP